MIRHTSTLLVVAAALLGTGCSTPGGIKSFHVSEDVSGLQSGTFRRLDSRLLKEEKAKGGIVGGTLIIHRAGESVYEGHFGHLNDEPNAAVVSRNTLFDIASITKPLVGVPIALRLIETFRRSPAANQIRAYMNHTAAIIDEDLESAVKAFQTDVERIKTYSAEKNYDNVTLDLAEEINGAYRKRRAEFPGTTYHYSNLGYYMISVGSQITQRLAPGESLDPNPLKLPSFTFTPPEGADVASPGRDSAGELIVSHPYDPMADFLVRGAQTIPTQSGLFLTGTDVAAFVDAVLQPDATKQTATIGQTLFGMPTELPTININPNTEKPKLVHVSEGGLVSPTGRPWASDATPPGRIYCQTGYTGCLLWVDVKERLVIVLLTNASLTKADDRWEALSREVVGEILAGRND